MIKLLRMKSGEDVLCDVTETESDYRVSDPAVLMPMSSANDKMQMAMVPWQPFSKCKEFDISKRWIITVSEPTQEVEDNYRKIFGSGIEITPPNTLLG